MYVPATGRAECILDFNIGKETTKYIILEQITPDKNTKIAHVLNFTTSRVLSVGNSSNITDEENDLSINEPSVSGRHAYFRAWNVYDSKLKIMKGMVSLADKYSNYGTYVLVQKPLTLYPNEFISLVIYNT